MNAMLNIVVRVNSAQALAALKQVQAATKATQGAGAAAGNALALGGLAGGAARLDKFGKNLQWTGRQLEFNFTLPLLLAGAAATKWALDNEKASTRLRKVYGDLTTDTKTIKAETDALGRSFELLSNRFGVSQKEVIDIGASWAAAGAQGVAVANATRATLEAMILGEMDHETAVRSLIGIQAQYKLSTVELRNELANLNVIENETGIGFSDLIDVITRAGGSAKAAGIEIRELGAYAAALVPSTGSAAQAGNALRTILSRIMAPTEQSAEAMSWFGINVTDASWQAQNGSERMQTLVRAFGDLSDAEKNNVGATIASRWQINRFSTIMEDLRLALDDTTKAQSLYNKAMEATDPANKVGNQTKAQATYVRELNTYLGSTPQRFKILTTTIQNAMSSAIFPLLPALGGVIYSIANLMNGFKNLDPQWQQFIISGLLMLALLGPIARYLGSVSLLIATLAKGFLWFAGVLAAPTQMLGGFLGRLMALLAWPFNNFLRMMGGVFTGVANGLIRLSAFMSRSLLGLARFIGDFGNIVRGIWAATTATMGALWQGLVGFMGPVWASFTGFLSRSWVTFLTFYGRVANQLSLAWGALTSFLNLLWVRMHATMHTTSLTFGDLWLKVQIFIQTAFQRIVLFMQGLWAAFQAFYVRASIAANAAVQRAWVLMNTAFGAVVRFLIIGWGRFITFITNFPAIMARTMVAVQAATVAALRGMAAAWRAFGASVAAVQMGIATVSSLGPAIIVAALVGALVVAGLLLRDKIGSFIDAIQESFNRLPEGVKNVLIALVRMVRDFSLQVYEWLSYINPFARHSPSLVEQVNAGVDLILNQYARLRGVGSIINSAATAHKNFMKATSGVGGNLSAAKLAKDREDVVSASPNAGGAFDAMVASIGQLYGALDKVGAEMAKQEPIVARWEAKLKSANRALDEQEAILDALKDRASGYRDELDAAQSVLDSLTETPLQGMRAMSDAIFANEMAQKKLRLELLRMEEVNGPVEDFQDRISKLQGEIERLRATQTTLRFAGAGSDVLSFYDEQIAALEAQQQQIGAGQGAANELKDQLSALERQGQILDLENSLKFDPLTRQIEQATDAMTEMPFDELMSKIIAQQAEVTRLESQWGLADQAVQRQQLVVDQLTASRDALQRSYDAEKQKLDDLKSAYSDIEAQIREMESALTGFASQARQAAEDAGKISLAEAQFLASEGADFGDVGGSTALGREGGLPEIEDFNAELERELENAMKDMDFDMWAPFKDMWDGFVEWFRNSALPVLQPLIDWFKTEWQTAAIVAGTALAIILLPFTALGAAVAGLVGLLVLITTQVDPVREAIVGAAGAIWGFINGIWQMIAEAEPVRNFFGSIWDNIVRFGNALKDEGEKWGVLWEPLQEAAGHIWTVLKWLGTVIGVILGGIVAFFTITLWPILENIVRPLFDAIIGVVVGAMKFLRGFIEVILSLINGDWGKAWDGVKTMFAGIWDAIYGILKGALGIIWGTISGLVEGIVNAFTWLWDVLVGHSIVPDMVNAIIGWFKFLFEVGKTIFSAIVWVIVNILAPVFRGLMTVVGGVFVGIATVVGWAWNNVIMPLFTLAVWYITNVLIPVWTMIFTVASIVFEGIAKVVTWAWQNIVMPIFDLVVAYISNILIPWWGFLFQAVSFVFGAIAGVIQWAWNNVIKPIWTLIKAYISAVLVPIFQWLWAAIKFVWNSISTAIQGGWQNVIRPIWNAVRDYITNTLVPKFNEFKEKARLAWELVRSGISAAWDRIRPVFEAVCNFIVNTLIPKFGDFKDRVVDAWDLIESKTSTVFNSVKTIIRNAINTGIRAINGLIGGLNAVADILPGLDWSISEIALVPAFAAGGRIGATPTTVGGGFVTRRPRAIVGEGSPLHPEFVIPTDPKYRSRAMGLFSALGSKLMGDGVPQMALGGIIPDIGGAVEAVKNAATGGIASIREGAAMAAFAPFNVIADSLIGQIAWDKARQPVKSVKDDVYNWVKGTDDQLNEAVRAAIAAAQANAGRATGLHPKFVEFFNNWNASLNNKFRIGSGWRSYEAQAALYNDYINGVPGQAPAAPPGRSNHEKGLAIDLSPSRTTGAERAAGAAFDLRWPMSYEPWHVEPANIPAFLARYGPAPGAYAVTGTPGGAGVKFAARALLNQYGWGAQWNALDSLLTRESSWNPLAQNPHSTAFGLFQFLNSTWGTVGGTKTSDYNLQLRYGFDYIRQRYGDPNRAWDFWQRNHWYASGGMLPIDAALASGGMVVPRRPGGTNLLVGEGRHSEKVQVLPLRGGDDEKGKTLNFYGDLSFPNITNGDDANDFVENLKSLGDE